MDFRIDDFFANSNILITGATGFIGKVLLEKLLRSQSNTGNLFLMIRSKKGKTIDERADECIFDQPIFENVKKENPNYKDKITLIDGNILETGLGLSEKDKQNLINQVNIVFNCAASVNMAVNLKYNVKHNIESVFELLELCRQMKNLKSLVLVSTAYSNCNRDFIEEKIYDTSVSPELVFKLCKEIDGKVLEHVTELILDGHPNTYTFSKSLMESSLRNYKDLPLVVFRPAIVIGSYKEPLPGWVDNQNGPMGSSVGISLGILRVLPCDSDKRGNWIPVDYCVNALICSSWHGVRNRSTNDSQMMVYNYTCEKIKRSYKTNIETLCGLDLKSERCIWKMTFILVRNDYVYLFLRFVLELIPALFVDILLTVSGNKFRLTRLYKEKIYPKLSSLKYFMCKEYTFSEKNVDAMWRSLSLEEKKRYPFNSADIDFKHFMWNFAMGVKVFLMKEKLEDNHKAVKRQKILTVIHYIFLAIFWSGVMWILYSLFFK